MNELFFLKESIEKLDTSKHIGFLKICKHHKVDFSENKNGVFINLSSADDIFIKEIKCHLEYLSDQDNTLEIREKEVNAISNDIVPM